MTVVADFPISLCPGHATRMCQWPRKVYQRINGIRPTDRGTANANRISVNTSNNKK